MRRRLRIARFTILFCAVLEAAAPCVAQEARLKALNAQAAQLQEQGKYAEAAPVAEQAVHVAEATFGPAHPITSAALSRLGTIYMDMGRYADAEGIFRRALNINEKALGPANAEVAADLANLGELYRRMGRYAEAEPLLLRSISIGEKLPNSENPAFATDLGNLAVLYEDQGRYREAEPFAQRSLAMDEKVLGAESEAAATDLNNLAALYYHQGKYADAEPLYVKALAIHLKLLGNEHPVVATDLSNLANLYASEGKYPTAEPIYRRALAIDEKSQGNESLAAAADANNLAAMYQAQGRFSEAEPLYRNALAIREKALGPEHPAVAASLSDIAEMYYSQGRYAEAEPMLRQALAIREKKLGPDHPQVAASLNNLAALYKDQGRYAEAEPMYRRAVTIDLKALGPEHRQVAMLLGNLAELYFEQGRLAEAEPLLRGALAINEKALGPDHPEVAMDLNNLAEEYEAQRRYAEAEPLIQRSLAIDEKILGPNNPDVATRLVNLGGLYCDEGKFAEAEPLLKRAVSIFETSLGPDHPRTREAVLNLAVTYYGWGKPDLAGPYFDRNLGNLQKQFDSSFTYMSEKERLQFLNTVPGAFPLFFSFSLTYHDRDPGLAGKMYDVLLWEKGFIAESAAALRAKILASGDPEALALLDKLTAKKTQLAALASAPQGDPAQWRKNIAQLDQEANDIEKELVKRSSALAEQKTLAHITWRDVQKTLKPGEAAVEFARFQFHNGKSWTSTNYYVALIVTPETATAPKLVVLGEAQKLESTPLASYRAGVGRTRGVVVATAPAEQAGADAGAGDAYNAFWKPIEPALGAAKRVYVSSDGVLNQISVGLFSDATGKLLLEKYDLRLVNSTKDLLRPAHNSSSKTAVLLGNPAFDLTEAQQRAALAKLGASAPARSLPGYATQTIPLSAAVSGAAPSGNAHVTQLPPLPATQVEIDSVGKLLKNAGWQAAPYTGELALEEVLDRQRSPRVVHVATHGFFLSDQEIALEKKPGAQVRLKDPMLRSGLFFAGADRAESGAPPAAGLDDGVLTAYQAAQLDLQGTELVVLSACETGLGEQKNGEGVFGLRRGLQEAGAEAVLMSMWSVPDRETQELMALFYQNWLGGLDKHEALRQAQIKEREAVRQRYGKDLPFYWGAFVLVGR
jgi:tetratricopeptide (TPR) repeat protein